MSENIDYSNFKEFAKRKPELTVLTDHPLTEEQAQELFKPDPFNFRFKLGPVFDILRHPETKTPMSILISGGWGTGKTSAMKWLDSLITEWKNHADHDDIKVRSVWFYPWKYDNKEDVWKGLIAEVIINAIDPKYATEKTVLKAAKLLLTFAGETVIDILEDKEFSLYGIKINSRGVKKLIRNYKKANHPEKPYLNEYEQTLKDWIKDVVPKDNGRMIIFIDDLDRCMPDIALQVLEAIKLYLNIPNLVFVLGVDKEVIEDLVVEHYKKLGLVKERKEEKFVEVNNKREKTDAKARQYLSKMFQVEIELSPSEEQIIHFFDKQLDAISYWNEENLSLNEREIFRELILKLADRNPREVKRLLNSSLMMGVGADLLEDNIEFRQGMQLYFVRRILDKYSMTSDAGSKRGISFFIQWSRIIRKIIYEDLKVPFNVFISNDLKEKISKILNDSYETSQEKEINDSEFVENYLNEALFSKEDISSVPSEYLTLLKDKNNLELLHLLSDIDLGKLMQIPYPEEAAEVIAGDKINISDFVKASISRKLDKKIDDVKESDYDKITELDFSNTDISNIEFINGLINLKELLLKGTEVSDLKPLRGLTKLQRLDLNKTRVSDISPLSDLTNLNRLSINSTLVANLEPLINLTNLIALDLDKDEVSDLGPLSNLTNLQRLYLRKTKVSDIGPLSGLIELRELFLHFTSVSNLEPLTNLTNLVRLGINNTLVSNLEPLKNLTNLVALDLGCSKVTSIEPLKDLSNLQRLYLNKTEITDFRPITSLTNLQLLDLVNTQIDNLESIKTLNLLKEIRLLNCNNINDKKIIDLQEALPDCRIIVELEDIILNNSFRLIYRPGDPEIHNKIMKFAKGGLITEGNNNNETTWQIKKGYLEFLNSEGKVHSRFYYNPVTNRFDHTNDRDTRSIRGQYIIPVGK